MNTRGSIWCLAIVVLSSQVKAQMGYLRKDSHYIQANISDEGLFNNNRQLRYTENSKTVIYTPDQVEEYGLVNGDVYIKRTVQNGEQATHYFLRRLVNGERTLYSLKEKKGFRFFIESESALVEIKKEIPLQTQLLAQLKNCGAKDQIAKETHYGETSLKRAVMFNNKCYSGFFPRLRVGALAGYEFSQQSLGTVADHIFLQASTSAPFIGIFLDVPLGMSSSWFMIVQATYQQNNFSKYQVDNNLTVEYQDNFSTIGLPLLLKYRGTSSLWRPFVAFGPTSAIYTQQQNAWLSTTYLGSLAYLDKGTWDDVKKFQVSATLCAGLEYSITPANAISFELRFKKLIDVQVGPTQSFALIGSFYF